MAAGTVHLYVSGPADKVASARHSPQMWRADSQQVIIMSDRKGGRTEASANDGRESRMIPESRAKKVIKIGGFFQFRG